MGESGGEEEGEEEGETPSPLAAAGARYAYAALGLGTFAESMATLATRNGRKTAHGGRGVKNK